MNPSQNENDMLAFLETYLDEQEKKARGHRKVRDIYGHPCPSCGKPAEGFGTPWGDHAAVRVTHSGLLSGCDLTAEEWTDFGDDGITDEGARTLREVEAKRQRLTLLSEALGAGHDSYDLAAALLPYELLPYSDRPGYREEWRP